MHSPTALTPEPAGDISSSMDSQYTTSIEASLGQVSISLTPSPLAVRPLDDNSLNSGVSVHKSIQEIALDNNTSSNTPNKPTVLNQTPLRSTSSFLTPPSSDERPAAPAISLATTQPAPVFSTEKKITLAEKIMAQSALYSQAIQKQQQQQHTTSPEHHPAPKSTSVPPRDGAIANHFTSHRSTPQFTYHQLQQQQFLNRQNISTQDQKKQDSVTAGDKLVAAKSNLTATEIPAGASPKEVDTKSNGPKKVNDGSVVTPSITKTDPLDNPLNTTNVYINGLPLRWTDDDLYRLTRGFGAVKSVKMFTRHLEDKPSAYGFVLFNCIEDAERFITTLRQHTQFHPSFAKTMKVPGTTNAKHAIADPVIPPPRGEDYADISITGLPLTIDMQTLATLFAPQAIKASKFFHTAGTPRRLVGFIRLESRQAAEDIVERLHGSNVLGWSEKLEVHHLDSTSNNATNNPDLAAHGLGTMNLSHTNGLEPSMHQPIFDVAPIPPFSIPTPSIGVYQHQDLQLNDLSRLLETMKLSFDPQNNQTNDPAAILQAQGQSNISQTQTQTQTTRTSSLFDLAQLQTLASITAANRQTQMPSTGHNAGLGINMGSFAADPSEPSPGTLAFHQYRQVQDTNSNQPAQFQTTYGTSTEALQVLQAAVNIQDRALSGTSVESATTSPVIGFRPDERIVRESSFPNLRERVPGSAIDNDHPLGRMRGFSESPRNAAGHIGTISPFSGKSFHRAGMRIPPPILPGTAVGTIASSFHGTAMGNGGNVPHLLPALSPSSPHASSEESSPITPTFQQLPRHLVGEHEKDN